MNPISSKIYKHGRIVRLFTIICARIMLGGLIFAGTIAIIRILLSLFSVIEPSQEYWINLFGCVFSLPWVIFLGNPILNLYSQQIEVINDGINVEVVTFFTHKWVFISWEEMVEVQNCRFSCLFPKPIFGLITRRKISLWHQIIGTFYGYMNRPVLVLMYSIENRDELISTINSKINLDNLRNS
jgi:hypothetical protein